ncbi:MAG TPA: HAD-IA family hydrolase, partial [Stenomitos sp.]
MVGFVGAAMGPARALVFDKDGVIVDFARYWCAMAQARAEAIAQRAALSPEDVTALLALSGVPAGEIDPTGPLATGSRVEELTIAASFLYQRGKSWLEARAIAEASFEAAEAEVDPAKLVRPTGPLVAAFERLTALGLKLAVATTDLTANAERDLRLLGLDRYFEVVLGADAVARNKPHPDMFLRACQLMGVRADEAWMVGDAVNDLRMARAAGAAGAIAVTSGVTSREMLSAEADVVLVGVWELPEHLEAQEAPAKAIDPEAWYVLYSDGASRGNPGPAALGAVLVGPDGEVVAERSERLGVATNNVAEYRALLSGIEAARTLGIRRLVVRADSELMIKQLKGAYSIKSDALRPLYRQAMDGLKAFEAVRLEHVPRAQN